MAEHQRPDLIQLRESANLVSDVEPDAVPEQSPNQNSRQEARVVTLQHPVQCLEDSLRSLNFDDISDEDIEYYKNQFPENIRSDVYDAMILHQDEDTQEALQFLSCINSNVCFRNGEKPKVVLYTDVRSDIGIAVGQLDESLSLCTYVFLFVTKKFCLDAWMKFSSQTCLMDAIRNAEKKWSVVPIFTESRKQATYEIPPTISSLIGIQYWGEKKNYVDSLQRKLECKLHERTDKEVGLKHKRKLWIMEKKAEEKGEAERREQEIQQSVKAIQERYKNEKQEKENRDMKAGEKE